MNGSWSRTDRKNFRINILEAIFYLIGSNAFLSPQTTLPAIVSTLGGSTAMIGLVPVIAYGGWLFPQIPGAAVLSRFPVRKKAVLLFGFLQRIVPFLIAAAVFIFGAASPGAALFFVLVLYLVNQVLCGLGSPPWWDMMSKVTLPNYRGRLISYRTAFGNLAAVGGGAVVGLLFSFVSFPLNIALIFLGAFIVESISLGLVTLIEETPSAPPVMKRHRRGFGYYSGVIRRNRNFRLFIIACIFMTIATMSHAFFIVHALNNLRFSTATIGAMTMTVIAGQIAGALTMGILGDRYGFTKPLTVAAACQIIAVAAGLLSGILPGLILVSFFCIGLNLGLDINSRFNLALEMGTEETRPDFFALLNTVSGPFYLFSFAAGIFEPLIGITGIFCISGLFAAAAMAYFLFVIRDPRDEGSEVFH